MASSKKSLILKNISGKVGNHIVKQYRYGTVVTRIPDMSGIVPSPDQAEKRSKFKDAVAFAKSVVGDPVKKAQWKKRTRKGKTVYHTALSAYLKGKA